MNEYLDFIKFALDEISKIDDIESMNATHSRDFSHELVANCICQCNSHT